MEGKQKANEVGLNRSSLQSQPHTNTVNQITTPLTLVVLANVPVLTLLVSLSLVVLLCLRASRGIDGQMLWTRAKE